MPGAQPLLPVVTEVDRLTHGRELAGVPERPLVIETPELTGEEALVPGKETGSAGRWKGRMIRLGGIPFAVARLGAGMPCTLEMFQVSPLLWITTSRFYFCSPLPVEIFRYDRW